jgi:hypothetical protein
MQGVRFTLSHRIYIDPSRFAFLDFLNNENAKATLVNRKNHTYEGRPILLQVWLLYAFRLPADYNSSLPPKTPPSVLVDPNPELLLSDNPNQEAAEQIDPLARLMQLSIT